MDEKVLLVLGASSDVGAALIEESYTEYDKIIAHYNTSRLLLNKLQEKFGDKLQLLQSDFTDEISVNKFIENIHSCCESPSHIVHFPAPKVLNHKFNDLEWNDFKLNFNIQLGSIFRVLKEFLPYMAKKKYGKIVFMLTSYTMNIPPKNLCEYITAKYALLGFMKAISSEYSNKCININAVSPYLIETKFLNNISHLSIEMSAKNSPMKRNAEISDVVPMIRFLLSDKSNYIMGQNIIINGGNTI